MPEYYVERENSSLSEYEIEFFLQRHSSRGFTTRSHIHPALELIFIQNGEYSVSVDNDEIHACQGDLLFFRSNTIHSIQLTSDSAGSYYVLKINPSYLFSIFRGSGQMNMTSHFLLKRRGDRVIYHSNDISPQFKSIFDRMINTLANQDSFFYSEERAYSSLLLVEMLRSMLRDHTRKIEINEKNLSLIHTSVEYINKNYASDISAEECAASIHMSYSYFARLFREVMGRTFKEYLVSVRLAKAKSIILSTQISITDVATACGYSNLAYFISQYKKEFGKTPRDERNEVLKG